MTQESDGRYLFQCHWQHRTEHDRTEWVAQAGFTADEIKDGAVLRWSEEVFTRRQAEMPDGWCPMVCDQTAPCFVLAAPAVEA